MQGEIDDYIKQMEKQLGYKLRAKRTLANDNLLNFQKILSNENFTINNQLWQRKNLFQQFVQKLLWVNSSFNFFIYQFQKIGDYKNIYQPFNFAKLYQYYLNQGNKYDDVEFLAYIFEFRHLVDVLFEEKDKYVIFLLYYLKTKFYDFKVSDQMKYDIQQIQLFIPKDVECKYVYMDSKTNSIQVNSPSFKFYSLDLAIKYLCIDKSIENVIPRDSSSQRAYFKKIQPRISNLCKKLYELLMKILIEKYAEINYGEEFQSYCYDHINKQEQIDEWNDILEEAAEDIKYQYFKNDDEIIHAAKSQALYRQYICCKNKHHAADLYKQYRQFASGNNYIPLIKKIYDIYQLEHKKDIEKVQLLQQLYTSNIESRNVLSRLDTIHQYYANKINDQNLKNDSQLKHYPTYINQLKHIIKYITGWHATYQLKEPIQSIEIIIKQFPYKEQQRLNAIIKDFIKDFFKPIEDESIYRQWTTIKQHDYTISQLYTKLYDQRINYIKSKFEEYKKENILKYYYYSFTIFRNTLSTKYICEKLNINENDTMKIQFIETCNQTLTGEYKQIYNNVQKLFIELLDSFNSRMPSLNQIQENDDNINCYRLVNLYQDTSIITLMMQKEYNLIMCKYGNVFYKTYQDFDVCEICSREDDLEFMTTSCGHKICIDCFKKLKNNVCAVCNQGQFSRK